MHWSALPCLSIPVILSALAGVSAEAQTIARPVALEGQTWRAVAYNDSEKLVELGSPAPPHGGPTDPLAGKPTVTMIFAGGTVSGVLNLPGVAACGISLGSYTLSGIVLTVDNTMLSGVVHCPPPIEAVKGAMFLALRGERIVGRDGDHVVVRDRLGITELELAPE